MPIKSSQLAALLRQNPAVKVQSKPRKPWPAPESFEGQPNAALKTPVQIALDKKIRAEKRQIRKTKFAAACLNAGLPEPTFEHPFDERVVWSGKRWKRERKWQFDYCWPQYRVALESEGAVFMRGKDGKMGGRHNRPGGYKDDQEKYTEAAVQGWLVLKTFPEKETKPATMENVRRALMERGWQGSTGQQSGNT